MGGASARWLELRRRRARRGRHNGWYARIGARCRAQISARASGTTEPGCRQSRLWCGPRGMAMQNEQVSSPRVPAKQVLGDGPSNWNLSSWISWLRAGWLMPIGVRSPSFKWR